MLLVLLAVGVVGFAALAVRLLIVSRPIVGGVDFYHNILFSRDLAGGVPSVTFDRYIYFPGGYSFWTTVFRMFDGSLASLQWAYVGVLFANALLIGGVLKSLTGFWQVGMVAGTAYIFAATKIDGFEGVTEPIATIPYLSGLWLWILMTARGQRRLAILALATGLGLALFSKQQGGLLSLGMLGLLPALWCVNPACKYRLVHLVALPAGIAGVFLLAMAAEGGGIQAVQRGLLFASEYQAQGAWVQHVERVRSVLLPISSLFLSGCAVWLCIAVFRKRMPVVSDVVFLTLGMAIFSALGCLLQYVKRGYLHYALMLLPSALIVSGLAVFVVVHMLKGYALKRSRYVMPVVLSGTVLFFVGMNWEGAADFVGHVSDHIAAPSRKTPSEVFGGAIAPLCAHLQPGSELLLVPTRENRVHWFCKTRAVAWEGTYTWLMPEQEHYLPAMDSPSLKNVFVFSEDYGDFEKQYVERGDWGLVLREMERLGFRQVFASGMGRLFRKEGG